MLDLILAIDQGTTNTKAIVVDRDSRILARASVPVEITFPKPAWVEQNPVAIWEGVESVIDSCLKQIAPDVPNILGISNQRETVLIGIGRPANRSAPQSFGNAGGRPISATNYVIVVSNRFCESAPD